MRIRARRWPEVRGLLAALLAQVSFATGASLYVSLGLTIPGAGRWVTSLILLLVLSSLTITVAAEASRTVHGDLAALAVAIASASQALYTAVITA